MLRLVSFLGVRGVITSLPIRGGGINVYCISGRDWERSGNTKGCVSYGSGVGSAARVRLDERRWIPGGGFSWGVTSELVLCWLDTAL